MGQNGTKKIFQKVSPKMVLMQHFNNNRVLAGSEGSL